MIIEFVDEFIGVIIFLEIGWIREGGYFECVFWICSFIIFIGLWNVSLLAREGLFNEWDD